MILPFSSIASTLSGATINNVEVFIQRQNTSHGTVTGTVRIWTHSSDQLLNSWTGTGIIQRGSSSINRGEGKWISVSNAVGNGLRDSTIRGLALYTSSLSAAEYIRTNPSSTRIRITYTK